MDIVKYNLTNIKYNLTNGSVGSIKVYLNTSISKKERGLSEAVSTNLMQQLGSLKDTFDTYLKQKLSLHELYSQILKFF